MIELITAAHVALSLLLLLWPEKRQQHVHRFPAPNLYPTFEEKP
jgi:hypothetical protein